MYLWNNRICSEISNLYFIEVHNHIEVHGETLQSCNFPVLIRGQMILLGVTWCKMLIDRYVMAIHGNISLSGMIITGLTSAAEHAYPTISAMLSFLRSKHQRLSMQAQAAEKLMLEPKAFLALLKFLRSCREHCAYTDKDTSIYQGEHKIY